MINFVFQKKAGVAETSFEPQPVSGRQDHLENLVNRFV
jgi:xylose isomerase